MTIRQDIADAIGKLFFADLVGKRFHGRVIVLQANRWPFGPTAKRALGASRGAGSLLPSVASSLRRFVALPQYLLPPQDVMVVLGETVGLVPDGLAHPKARVVSPQADRL